MTEDVIERVDDLIRKNIIKYQGIYHLTKIRKAKKNIKRLSRNIKDKHKNLLLKIMPI